MGYFPERNLETVFYTLNEGLRLIREKLGEQRYLKLMEMSDRMPINAPSVCGVRQTRIDPRACDFAPPCPRRAMVRFEAVRHHP